MKNIFWRLVAGFVTIPWVRNWIIKRALLAPYYHLPSYMNRYWLFNPYDAETKTRKWPRIPISIRLHQIQRADDDRHEHNHPWDARTIILDGFYIEQRNDSKPRVSLRDVGYTGPIKADQFHRIREVSQGGVWTLFIMYKLQGEWGFKTGKGFVRWKDYKNLSK